MLGFEVEAAKAYDRKAAEDRRKRAEDKIFLVILSVVEGTKYEIRNRLTGIACLVVD